MFKVFEKSLSTPIGAMQIIYSNYGIHQFDFKHNPNYIINKNKVKNSLQQLQKLPISCLQQYFQKEIDNKQLLSELQKQLKLYFHGNLKQFDLTLSPFGTKMQLKTWEILREVPYGKVFSYQKVAELLGNPNAIRAVANASAHNRISIIAPCHRIIRKNGSLGGYAGGLSIKKYLLELEGASFKV